MQSRLSRSLLGWTSTTTSWLPRSPRGGNPPPVPRVAWTSTLVPLMPLTVSMTCATLGLTSPIIQTLTATPSHDCPILLFPAHRWKRFVVGAWRDREHITLKEVRAALLRPRHAA